MLIRLIGLLVPLALDTFAVSAALGMAGLPRRQRFRVSVLFTAFEVGMPLVGFLGGRAVGQVIGDLADFAAIAILVALGVYMVWPWRKGDEHEGVELLTRTHGLAALGLGVSISLDELAIGFTLGLLRLPILLVLAWIAVQTFVATQVGLRLGARVGEQVREGAERLAGVALTLLGLFLLADKLLHFTR